MSVRASAQRTSISKKAALMYAWVMLAARPPKLWRRSTLRSHRVCAKRPKHPTKSPYFRNCALRLHLQQFGRLMPSR